MDLLENWGGIFYKIGKDIPHTGEVIKFYESGEIYSKSNYVNGKINGEVLIYRENGKVIDKSNYIDNKLNGESFVYNENDKISVKSKWKNGEKNEEISFYENGAIYSKSNWKNGFLHKKHTPPTLATAFIVSDCFMISTHYHQPRGKPLTFHQAPWHLFLVGLKGRNLIDVDDAENMI